MLTTKGHKKERKFKYRTTIGHNRTQKTTKKRTQ
jgi:hypothetical protein